MEKEHSEISKIEMGRACSTYGERRSAYRDYWGNLRVRDHMEDPEIDRRITLKWILEKWDGRLEWITLAQVRVRWRALLNAVMNLRVPQTAGNSLSS
jgi:hypothetical protein